MRADTIPARLLSNGQQIPACPAYHTKIQGAWCATDWGTYVQEVRRAGRALIALGLKPGGKVAMLGFNRPEWVIFNLAAMCAGGVGVGVYTTCSAEEVQYILHHAEAQVVLVEDESQWAKIQAQRDHLPLLQHVVVMKGASGIAAPGPLSWDELNSMADAASDSELDARVDALDPEALATLIYTSGTTGPPKGVMLSHGNLAWTASLLETLLAIRSTDTLLSYLPLAHIAEQMLSIHMPISLGASIYFAESMDKVLDNLREVQPTVFFAVPRVWEKLHAGISDKLGAATGLAGALVRWVRRVGAEASERANRGQAPGLVARLEHGIARYLLLSRLRAAIGLRNARLCVSGAAPISGEVLEFFASLGIIVHEVYGQSEGSGPTSFNFPGQTRFGTVGSPIPGIEVTCAEDGEILVKGPNVFMGYYKDEAATSEALVDGWLRSGDLGVLDEDGFLRITGRKKEIIITAGGKNITPRNIESALKNHRLISEVVVIGDRRKYLTALITVDEQEAARLMIERGSGAETVDQCPALQGEVQALVDQVNRGLARVETIKKFTILPGSFTTAAGDLTPTLKVKRSVVHQRYAREIDAMYSDG